MTQTSTNATSRQASATLFPAGWRMRTHIGKSLQAIINNIDQSMTLWSGTSTLNPLPTLQQS